VTIGERLRRERVRSGLTQAQLTKLLGVHRGYVWKIEHGAKPPSTKLIERWAQATGAAPGDLVLEGPPLFDLKFEVDTAVRGPFTARRVLDRIPPTTRRQVAVWPGTGDRALRLRVRGSALPAAIDLAGITVPGVGLLGQPSVVPVRAAKELMAWVRAASEADARAQVVARMSDAATGGRVTVNTSGRRVFVALVAQLSACASIRLQDIVQESAVGLFVPVVA
jgi:transcriptional regulator with XRE-family HTH domain